MREQIESFKRQKPVLSPSCGQLVTQYLGSKFSKLYAYLTPPQVELNAHNARVDRISASSLAVLQPLLDELRSMGEVLDCQEFTQSCLRLYYSLPVHERRTLLDFEHVKPAHQKEVFKHTPSLCKHSVQIVNSLRRRSRSSGKVEDRLIEGKKVSDHRFKRE